MTTKEFSDMFDTLLNSYSLQTGFGDTNSLREVVLDEYEKSVFLTRAQEQLIISYYSGNNSNGESFENTEEIRRYLSSLIKTAEISPSNDSSYKKLTAKSQLFTLPNDVWFITYESASLGSNSDTCLNEKKLDVVPVRQDYFHRVNRNPFRGPSERRALRLDIEGKRVELVSDYTINKYLIRYIVKPSPIILTDLEGVSIDGVSTEQTCALEESLHKTILDLAVRLALQSRGINLEKR